MGCAIMQRSLLRTETEMPAMCQTCFDKYCWDGTTDSTATDYNPEVSMPEDDESGANGWTNSPRWAVTVALVSILGLILL